MSSTIASKDNLDVLLYHLSKQKYLSLDTETTGLFPFHGDRLFSIIIATDEDEYYFNFKPYGDLVPSSMVLEYEEKVKLQKLLFNNTSIHWFIHNAIFDCPVLAVENMFLKGSIHCTHTGARVQYNEHNSYSLAQCGHRIGFEKNTQVEAYIKKYNLYTTVSMNGYSIKKPCYDQVDFQLMFTYGCQDARVCFALGKYQLAKMGEMNNTLKLQKVQPSDCLENEISLQNVLNSMQNIGVRIDTEYCHKAIEFFEKDMIDAKREFLQISGEELIVSSKCFSKVFGSEEELFEYTDKGNPSFPEAVLNGFKNPAAKCVLRYKAAKAKINFFHTFIKFTDEFGNIHTELKPYGTRTGRFSSANPNLQNLKRTSSQDLESFVVRRAIVPRTGYFFAMIDYDQIEYRLMLDYAKADGLIDKVLGGLDVHTATAEVAGVTRNTAKTVNFLTLYGGGIKTLATTLGVTTSRAKEIQSSIFRAAPEIRDFIDGTIGRAEKRGYIFNWLGRVSYFPKRSLCYKAPNTLIQGGAGDVCKVAMVECHALLQHTSSRLLLNVHDELIFEIAEDEADLLPVLQTLMARVYKPYRLPLTCGIEYSWKSLADKVEFTGLDDLYGTKPGNQIQDGDLSASQEAPKDLGKEASACSS